MTNYRINPNNPRKQASDEIPVGLRDWARRSPPLSPGELYNIIIPATKNHGSWILGAKPRFSELGDLLTQFNNPNIHIVRVIAPYEHEDDLFQPTQFIPKTHWLPWHDHGTLNTKTGKNETLESMHKFQGINIDHGLYRDFFAKGEPETNQLFYCHCMAGKSRSFLETIVFIYYCPDKEKLFDFDDPAWNGIYFGENSPEYLKARLQDNPSFTDISEFIKLQRALVKELMKLDGDQAGLVGLMSLDKWAESSELIKERNLKRLCSDASDIGLLLKAPLDRGFRDPFDVEKQKENIVKVYKAYEEQGINLLAAMIERSDNKENFENNFEENYNQLSPSEQVRFAILMKLLEINKCNLSPINKTPEQLAQIALKRVDELTAGDQVELLRTFGNLSKTEDYNSVAKKIAKKIVHGNPIDQYNAGIQLAELYMIAKKKESDGAARIAKEDAKLEKVSARTKPGVFTQISTILTSKVHQNKPYRSQAFTVIDLIDKIAKKNAEYNSLEEDERINYSIRLSELNDQNQQPTNASPYFKL